MVQSGVELLLVAVAAGLDATQRNATMANVTFLEMHYSLLATEIRYAIDQVKLSLHYNRVKTSASHDCASRALDSLERVEQYLKTCNDALDGIEAVTQAE